MEPRREHPRVCGENPVAMSWIRRKKGTPPRMRGKRAKVVSLVGTLRNTPAYAGKTESDLGGDFL